MTLLDRLQEFFLSEGLSRNTAGLYITKIKKLSGNAPGVPIRSLNFLMDIDDIESKIRDFSTSTQITYIASILASLKFVKKVPKKVLTTYQNMMGALADSRRKVDVNEKTESQEENWMSWDEVISKREECKTMFDEILSRKSLKKLSPLDFQKVQNYAVLCLYTMIPPRRNADYQEMVIVENIPEKQEKEMNYYGMTPKEFIFNNYKTSIHYGQQKLEVPADLAEVLDKYSLVIPGKPFKYMICKPNGEKLTYSNSITRIMNRIFKKNVSSSMLRHIFLTSKYDVDDMQKTADAMGHSLAEQREYLKKSKDADDEKMGGNIRIRLPEDSGVEDIEIHEDIPVELPSGNMTKKDTKIAEDLDKLMEEAQEEIKPMFQVKKKRGKKTET